mgnify:CR=1 FL=1
MTPPGMAAGIIPSARRCRNHPEHGGRGIAGTLPIGWPDMKQVLLPRDMSHVRKDGKVFCVLCKHLCMQRMRCSCCRPC